MTHTREKPEYHVLIAAAGSGQRLGAPMPKQYLPINGKALLRHTIDNVQQWPGIKSIRVIIDPSHKDLYNEATENLALDAPLHGGAERNLSIHNALANITDIEDDEIILIHDAARPFASSTDVENLLFALQTDRAATLAAPVHDTLRKSDNMRAQEIVPRQNLWAIQTPQAFRFGDLKKAHKQSETIKNITDDTSLVSALGIEVKIIPASPRNIKITTQDDLAMAQILLQQNDEIRTGQGFDVHAFELEKTDRRLILCGIHVEHDFALAGHSDADVGLHAITDALLGALGEGDIGQHFPPSDDSYKDMDSRIFLEQAVNMLHKRAGTIINIDVTLICEAPKIGPHSARMREKIAEICGIEIQRVNVKATTTEKLGFTGRREGIASQAIATIKLPV